MCFYIIGVCSDMGVVNIFITLGRVVVLYLVFNSPLVSKGRKTTPLSSDLFFERKLKMAKYKINDFVIVIDPDKSGLICLNIEKIITIETKSGSSIQYQGGLWHKLENSWSLAKGEWAFNENQLSGLYFVKAGGK